MNGFVVGGFVALHDIESDCYKIKNIKTNKEAPLMQRVAAFDKRPYHFEFFAEGVEMGDKCIEELLAQPPDISVVDEIGGYELAGELWGDSFTQLMESSVPIFFTTKDRLLERVMKKWKIEPTHIFLPEDFDDPHKAFEHIKKYLRK